MYTPSEEGSRNDPNALLSSARNLVARGKIPHVSMQLSRSAAAKNAKKNAKVLNNASFEDIMEMESNMMNASNDATSTESWFKLSKSAKLAKLMIFVEQFSETHNLSQDEKNIMVNYLRECLDKKKLQRIKDVIYNRENGQIVEIPDLVYIRHKKHFTLRNNEKKSSTLRSLGPRKTTARKPKDKTDTAFGTDDKMECVECSDGAEEVKML